MANDPKEKLEKILEKLGWERVTDRLYLDSCRWVREEEGLWENDKSRLLVDGTGVFLFRADVVNPTGSWRRVRGWVRTAGLSHDRISPRTHELVFPNGWRLDLGNGAWEPQECPTASK